MTMDENVAVVFHGFVNLTNLEKLKLTEKINEYLDAMHREPLRQQAEAEFQKIEIGTDGKICKCCGR